MPKEKNLLKTGFNLDPAELSATQKRLIQSMAPLLSHLLSTDDEEEFFEASKELLQISASLIKQSHFPQMNATLPYGDQAVEYAMDQLTEVMTHDDPIKWDN